MTHDTHDTGDRGYDQAYGRHGALFGVEPSSLLAQQLELIPADATVLDIGCGQGRNSLYLARRGHVVHALDPSSVAIHAVTSAATAQGLAVEPKLCGFEGHDALAGTYGVVLAFGIIQVLDRAQLAELASRVSSWLAPGGLLFVTAFTTEDPCISAGIRGATPLGRGSWRLQDGSVRTWLAPGELGSVFPEFEPLVLSEGLGSWHVHGDGEREQHHVASGVLQRGR